MHTKDLRARGHVSEFPTMMTIHLQEFEPKALEPVLIITKIFETTRAHNAPALAPSSASNAIHMHIEMNLDFALDILIGCRQIVPHTKVHVTNDVMRVLVHLMKNDKNALEMHMKLMVNVYAKKTSLDTIVFSGRENAIQSVKAVSTEEVSHLTMPANQLTALSVSKTLIGNMLLDHTQDAYVIIHGLVTTVLYTMRTTAITHVVYVEGHYKKTASLALITHIEITWDFEFAILDGKLRAVQLGLDYVIIVV